MWSEEGTDVAPRYAFTISQEHVGQTSVFVHPYRHLTSNWIGQILPSDVGKRVYVEADVLTVENDKQRDRRLGL